MSSTAQASLTEAASIDSPAWFLRLPDIGVTLVAGADADRFLQGQLSCNVMKLDNNGAMRGVLCNLKGRVVTDLLLVKTGQGILLLNWHGMQPDLIRTLDKYRVFFKTTLEPVDTHFCVLGLGAMDEPHLENLLGVKLPQNSDQALHFDAVTIIRLPSLAASACPARFLAVIDKRQHNGQFLQSLETLLPCLPAQLWDLCDIREGIAHIQSGQSEIYTPQLLNYDINGIIDFKKGCYTGQEIVARMHYRAEAKRRLFHLQAINQSIFEQQCADLSVEDVVVKQLLPDGSLEALVILPVEGAQNRPGVRLLSVA